MNLIKKAGGLLLSLVLLMSMLSIVALAEAPANFPAGYTELELEWAACNYYNSSKSALMIAARTDGSAGWWYCTTEKFTKADLPNGSVIVIQPATSYAAEGWADGALNDTKAATVNVAKTADVSYVVVDDAWWGTFTERAFNVRPYPAKDLTGEDKAELTNEFSAKFKIYVPTSTGGDTGSDTEHTHAHGTEWKKDANNHWNECACGDKANKAAHADANVDGKCDVCAYEVAADNDNPQTGDNSMITLWVTLLCVSACGFVVIMMSRKKSAF